jgi:hypothetical protein
MEQLKGKLSVVSGTHLSGRTVKALSITRTSCGHMYKHALAITNFKDGRDSTYLDTKTRDMAIIEVNSINKSIISYVKKNDIKAILIEEAHKLNYQNDTIEQIGKWQDEGINVIVTTRNEAELEHSTQRDFICKIHNKADEVIRLQGECCICGAEETLVTEAEANMETDNCTYTQPKIYCRKHAELAKGDL